MMDNNKGSKIKKLNEEELGQVTGGIWKPGITDNLNLNLLPRTGDTDPLSDKKDTQFRDPGVFKA